MKLDARSSEHRQPANATSVRARHFSRTTSGSLEQIGDFGLEQEAELHRAAPHRPRHMLRRPKGHQVIRLEWCCAVSLSQVSFHLD
jgi:hypothetical protein